MANRTKINDGIDDDDDRVSQAAAKMDASDGYVAPPRHGPNPFAMVDENVTEKLPQGCSIVAVTAHGSSFWTQTARLEVELADRTPKSYFLKVALEEKGRRMINGEFESMSALYATSPDFLPKPHAWGSYKSIPDTHFLLLDFHDMVEELPDINRFTKMVAELHLRSIPLSPNGKYGFHVTTYMGPLPQDNTWTDTWEEYFINGMKRMLMLERAAQGPSPELDELVPRLYEKVIPRLLRPLETGSNPIKPVLIHGDLWYGNCCTEISTDRPIVFDACSFWAHNEYEIGTWRALRYRFGRKYIKAYHKHFPVSAPSEDHDDRSLLYSIRFDLHSSAAYSSNPRFRRDVVDSMRRLVEKYPEGYEGWARDRELAQDMESLTT